MNASDSLSPLLEAFEHQDEVFASGFSILQEAILEEAFPAATVAVTHHGSLIALKALGHFTFKPNPLTEEIAPEMTERAPRFSRSSRERGDFDFQATKAEASSPFPAFFAGNGNDAVNPSTLFDLASLTKVVATTPMAMLLYQQGLLDLDAPVAAILPEFTTDAEKDLRRHDVTIRMLLSHCSGLPAYEKLFLKARSRSELVQAAFTTPLSASPATRAEYSDIGFIILGIALERLADEPLDRFCQREIFAPLAMTNTAFNPPPEIRAQIPPTADEREEPKCGAGTLAREMQSARRPQSAIHPSARSTFRQRIIQGEVQDENASVLGGVAAHAGLFSTAADLAKFAHAMLHGGRPILRPETISLFTRRESAPTGTSRTLGWDMPSSPSQSGKYFPAQSFGHLGYTGTSLWIDPSRQLSITLLTNRTWPDCSNQAIKKLRPKFHDAIIEALAD